MKKSLHIVSIKKPCRIQIIFGLCLAMLFTFLYNSNVVYALDEYDQNLYPVKSSRILADDSTVSKDIGLADANFSLLQSNVTGGLLYVDYVLNLVDNALTHVDSYFTNHINVSYNKNDVRTLLVAADNDYFVNREKFLNVYLVIDSNNNGTIWFQYNNGYMGFRDMPYTVENIGDNTSIYYEWYNYSDLNFASSYEINGIYHDFISYPSRSSSLYYTSIYNYGNLGYKSSDRVDYVNWLQNNWHNSYTNSNRFFNYYDSYRVTLSYALDDVFILPLYIDSDIYFPLSFVSPYNQSYEIHGNFYHEPYTSSRGCISYTPALGNISSDYFDSNLWYAGEFQSGIKGTTYPDPIITPIPTFAPIYTPTPFPTLNITATLTPIAIPNDPIISSGLGDPVSVVYGIIGYLTQVLSLPQIKFISTTVQYIYNSNIFFQILMFLVPGIILLTFMIGRLKRKNRFKKIPKLFKKLKYIS